MTEPQPGDLAETRIDFDAVGDALPALIERAAATGERLIVEKRGVRLAVIVPDAAANATRTDSISDEEAMALLGRMRAAFADQTEEEIVRETAKALAEVRAENLGPSAIPKNTTLEQGSRRIVARHDPTAF
ncbi:MAG: hypothetical protein H0U10_17480 [Chloroflexia bacterium]|nr:hypothetical protein [Chloroflexia bacterium]